MTKYIDIDFSRKKILRQSKVRPTAFTKNPIIDAICVHESALERDYFDYIMFDEGLVYMCSQPQTFKEINYTPDYYVEYDDRKKFIEIKYAAETQKPGFAEKIRQRTKFFKDLGFEYEVVTEETIRSSHKARNNRLIRMALEHKTPIEEFNKIKKIIPEINLSLKETTLLLIQHSFKPCFIRRALAHKLITADLSPAWSNIIINWR